MRLSSFRTIAAVGTTAAAITVPMVLAPTDANPAGTPTTKNVAAGTAFHSQWMTHTTPLDRAPAADAEATSAPHLTVLRDAGHLADGYLFTGPKTEGPQQPGLTNGPLISDDEGRPVWYQPSPDGLAATDVRVQTYRGRPVLTYWQGNSLAGFAHGDGTDYILNSHYQVIGSVRAKNGLDADQHEFWLTDRGTALITSYEQTTVDASSVGGPTDQQVLEGVVQEIDIRTGRLVFEWDSLDHIPLSDSYQPLPDSADTPWDYFHINAVRPDTDGNLLVSARHTWTIYKIDRHSGDVIWELGGKSSTFHLGHAVRFAWQHDPKPEGDGNYRIFDNESNGVPVRPQSRIITVHVDTTTDQATLVKKVTHPDHLSAPSQGDSQLLPDGNLIVGWGQLGRVSEFSPSGRLLLDLQIPNGQDTYRAYKYPWVGRPLDPPTLTATSDGSGSDDLDLVWNGATEVRQWRILGGANANHLTTYRTVDWDGLDTAATIADPPPYLQAVALDGNGHAIGRSAVVSTATATT